VYHKTAQLPICSIIPEIYHTVDKWIACSAVDIWRSAKFVETPWDWPRQTWLQMIALYSEWDVAEQNGPIELSSAIQVRVERTLLRKPILYHCVTPSCRRLLLMMLTINVEKSETSTATPNFQPNSVIQIDSDGTNHVCIDLKSKSQITNWKVIPNQNHSENNFKSQITWHAVPSISLTNKLY